MRGVNPSSCSSRYSLLAVGFALGCALLWNVVLLNQKVACDLAAQRLRGDATLTISTLRSQNDQLKRAVADGDCREVRDEADKCLREKQTLEGNKNELKPVASQVPLLPVPSARRIAVVMFCYNRPEYLERALNSLLKYLPPQHSLIVSQDYNDSRVTELLTKQPYASRLLHIQNVAGRVDWRERGKQSLSTYYFISSHYRFGLSTAFDKLQYDAVIVLEDDLEIAQDFFSYFDAMLPLLESDPTLYCASAWNDNGNPEFVNEAHYKELRRSDFFPGLGWLITRKLWNELGSRWPDGFWDDWMRLKEQRHDRHCIYPEVSRTYTFGAIGASQGQFYKDHLASIVLNKAPVSWRDEDLSYLSLTTWDEAFEDELQKASKTVKSVSELGSLRSEAVSMYYGDGDFKEKATALRIMSDMKEGVPRTAYRGVIKVHAGTNTVYLRPHTLAPRLK